MGPWGHGPYGGGGWVGGWIFRELELSGHDQPRPLRAAGTLEAGDRHLRQTSSRTTRTTRSSTSTGGDAAVASLGGRGWTTLARIDSLVAWGERTHYFRAGSQPGEGEGEGEEDQRRTKRRVVLVDHWMLVGARHRGHRTHLHHHSTSNLRVHTTTSKTIQHRNHHHHHQPPVVCTCTTPTELAAT
jgi:hypothetical protein